MNNNCTDLIQSVHGVSLPIADFCQCQAEQEQSELPASGESKRSSPPSQSLVAATRQTSAGDSATSQPPVLTISPPRLV